MVFLFEGGDLSFKCTSLDDGRVKDFEALKKLVPIRFASLLNEPAFSMDEGSCIWYVDNDAWVKLGINIKYLPDPTVVSDMTASDYCEWAEDYYERSFDPSLIKTVLEGGYTMEIAKQINPELDAELLVKDLSQIGTCA